MRRTGAVLAGLVLATMLASPAGAAPEPCGDPADPSYATYACKVQRLRERSFVVVALVDSGINPYHTDFRLPAGDDRIGVPPWEYIEGYPATSKSISLSLNEPSYEAARQKDTLRWQLAKRDTLHWFPGTNIVGGFSDSRAPWVAGTPILDENGHGTATASLAAGLGHGFARDTDVLVVMVEGIGPGSLEWAASQPWIDIVSNSWAYNANLSDFTTDDDEITKAATDAGKVIAFAAGNGYTNSGQYCDRVLTTTSPAAGPSWVLTVGAVSPKNDQATCWHSIPPDVSSYGSHWPAAGKDSLDGEITFGGTSCATPLTAGTVARQLLEARRALGDTVEGPHGGGALVVAAPGGTVPASGPLGDGRLDRAELEATTVKTAEPAPFDLDGCTQDLEECRNTTPHTPAYFVYEGYGIVNAASTVRALDVLLGRTPMPDRTDVDRWMLAKDTVSDAVWNAV